MMPEARPDAIPATSDGPAFSPGDVIAERYSVVRFLARGGMGEVYEVEDCELRAKVALKTIAPALASSSRQISRFRKEIQLARKVTHPNVCRVYDLGHHLGQQGGDVLFLTMELLEGETLSASLRRDGPVSCDAALPLIRQMVAGLSAAHQLGIVHRDFKPGNVILLQASSRTVVKITDFGLATNPECQDTISSSEADIVGTPAYMAPEQFRGQCSTRTDVYALGVTIFHMLLGQLPSSYEAPFRDTDGEESKRIARGWREAITRSLAVRPESRFASVEDFWRTLSGEDLARPAGWQAVVWGLKKYRRLATAVVLLAFATGIGMWAGVVPNPFRTLPREKHIAVLPFQNIGNDAANQAFTEGVADSLTSKLSQLERYQKSFWVVPANDTRNLKNLDEAYRNLGVTLAVTGSVQHTAEGVDLTANLVDPKDHRQISSRAMHVASADLDEMQQRVWESVADMLDLQVSQEIKDELAAGSTTQPGAYELYEQGVGYLDRYTLEDTARAIDLFEKALNKDPQYALAYAGLGRAYGYKYKLTKDPQWSDAATKYATRGVELNGKLLPVRAALGMVYQQTGQMDKALDEYRKVLDDDPSFVEVQHNIGDIYRDEGKDRQAEDAYRSVINRRPAYWRGYIDLGTLYYQRGQFSKAAEMFQTAVDLAPDNPLGYYNLGGAYAGLGRNEEAIVILQKGLSIAPDSNAWTNLGSAYMYVGRNEEAAEAMKKAADLSPHNHTMWRNLADSYHQIPTRQKEAKLAYGKALDVATAQLKVDPNNVDVVSGIALYEAHLERPREAEQYIGRARQLSPNSSDVLFTAALVYEIIGHRDRALTALDQAVKAGYSLQEIENEPELKALQADTRYRQWLHHVKAVPNDSQS